MTQQIERFAPHQNAKVFAILMAVSSLILTVPFVAIAMVVAPADASFPVWMVIVMPMLYLLIGYLSVAAGCWVYNLLVRYTGGIEFTVRGDVS